MTKYTRKIQNKNNRKFRIVSERCRFDVDNDDPFEQSQNIVQCHKNLPIEFYINALSSTSKNYERLQQIKVNNMCKKKGEK